MAALVAGTALFAAPAAQAAPEDWVGHQTFYSDPHDTEDAAYSDAWEDMRVYEDEHDVYCDEESHRSEYVQLPDSEGYVVTLEANCHLDRY